MSLPIVCFQMLMAKTCAKSQLAFGTLSLEEKKLNQINVIQHQYTNDHAN